MSEYVEHPWINPGTIEKRSYQESIVRSACTANTLCVLPTGTGKTNIAVLVSANRLQKDMSKKILMVAPTKPLVNQHRSTFEKFLKIGPSELVVVTGSEKPESRGALYKSADIIFATPQTIENDLENHVLNLKDFSLLIVDEAHRCVGNYAYVAVAKAYVEQSADPLILALTASPGGYKYKIDDVKKRLFIRNIEVRTRNDREMEEYIQPLDQTWIEVKLDDALRKSIILLDKCRDEKIQKLIEWRIINYPKINKVQIIKLQQELARKKTGSSFAAMSILAEIMKLEHAQILLETQSLYSFNRYAESLDEKAHETKATQRLLLDPIFIAVRRDVEDMLSKGMEHPKMNKLKEVVADEILKGKRIIIFTQYRDTIEKILRVLKNVPGANPVHFIGQAKRSGDAKNVTGRGMNQKEQIQTVNEFKLGFYNILVCTSIAEEGLDIAETDGVVFYEPIPSEVRRIQRMGRTARTRPGKVLFLITKGTRDEANYWASHHREKKMLGILKDMQGKNLNSF
ncbi:MAG: DEAD/DEAH box helicase [Candidatus Aenigmatarchaeota archaeon]